jgi:hypothetical protein
MAPEKVNIQIKSQEFEQLQRATELPVDGTDQDI